MNMRPQRIAWLSGLVLAANLMNRVSSVEVLSEQSQWSVSRVFSVRFTSQLTPLAINRIHSWVLHIEDAQGQPVPDAVIVVGGGMPDHNHGLPTSPRMTRNLGGGDYLIEGMKFHMNGRWEVSFDITAASVNDKVVFRFEL